MKLVEQRISDRRILKLIKQWLVSGVLYGNVLTISELGTSQGSVISPLLANIYLNTLDRLWEKYGHTHGILVRYADDTVIICKNKKSANHALNLLQYIMVKLDLKLHPVKTKIVSMWDGKEGFDFLGMHHRRMTTETRKGQLYKETYQYPSRKAMKKMKAEVKRNVNRRLSGMSFGANLTVFNCYHNGFIAVCPINIFAHAVKQGCYIVIGKCRIVSRNAYYSGFGACLCKKIFT